MPQAHPDLVARMAQWAGSLPKGEGAPVTLHGLDDVARFILKTHGYRFTGRGTICGPAPIEPAVADAIDYLVDEWDYAWEQDR